MASSPTCCGFWFLYGLIMTATALTECSDRELICEDAPIVDPMETRYFENIQDANWNPDSAVDSSSDFGYITDGYMVALQGKVDWLHTDPVMGEGGALIGYIPADYCPTYNAIFSVTNDKGLMCSIQITMPGVNRVTKEPTDPCQIILKSWSISLLYFDPEGEHFWYVDNINIQKGNSADFTKLVLKGVDPDGQNANETELHELFYLNLDGITYVRSAALTYMYDPDKSGATDSPTTSPTPSPVGRRRLEEEEQDSAYSRQGGKQSVSMSSFLSSLPLSNISVLGVWIGITLFGSNLLGHWIGLKKNAK